MSEREQREVKRLSAEQAKEYRNLRESNVPHETALEVVQQLASLKALKEAAGRK